MDAVIAGWSPRSLSPAAAGFVRGVVTRAAPGTPSRAKALLFAAGKLAGFGEQVGLELSAGVLLHPSVIERFIVQGTGGVSAASRRTLRTNLRALARVLQAYPQPAPVALPRERAKAPYLEGEIAGYLALAAAQSTRSRGMRATALVCLGAGAGLIGGELRHLRGVDVVRRSDGLLVMVGGARARAVPVLARFHKPLEQAAALAADGYLLGGSSAARRNLTDTLTARLCSDAGLPRLQPGRLRSTWLVACAERIGLQAFMHAAGITCSQRLGDLVSHLPATAEHETVRLLGGARDDPRDA
jgi:integrase